MASWKKHKSSWYWVLAVFAICCNKLDVRSTVCSANLQPYRRLSASWFQCLFRSCLSGASFGLMCHCMTRTIQHRRIAPLPDSFFWNPWSGPYVTNIEHMGQSLWIHQSIPKRIFADSRWFKTVGVHPWIPRILVSQPYCVLCSFIQSDTQSSCCWFV